MENFTAFNPVQLHFGKGVLASLPACIKPYGTKVLLIYGKQSIKQSGLYDTIVKLLTEAGIRLIEYGGIKPNPLVSDVDQAAQLGRDNQVDAVLAVGGGSVIDSAKIISITIPVKHSAWDFYEFKAKPVSALPLLTVLTLAATGTEMNPFAVLQNPLTGRKDGYSSPLCFPKHSFLDPELTYSVPAHYTAFGIADLMAHCFENYFSRGECSLSDRFIASILSDTLYWGPKLMKNLHGYDERAAIMYNATMALNLTTANGKGGGDWGVHGMGHMLSLLNDVAHGASLSILFPAWMRYHRDTIKPQLERLGELVFNHADADFAINAFEEFFREIGSPVRLSDVNIGPVETEALIEAMTRNKISGGNYKLAPDDYRRILQLAR